MHDVALCVRSIIVIDEVQSRTFICVPSFGISGLCLEHTGDAYWTLNGTLCSDGSGLYRCTLYLLAALSFVFISFCPLANCMPPSRPDCGHNFPLFFIGVIFWEGGGVAWCFCSEALAVFLVDGPLSAHRRRAALVACYPACARDDQTNLATTVLAVLCLASGLAKEPSYFRLNCTICCVSHAQTQDKYRKRITCALKHVRSRSSNL